MFIKTVQFLTILVTALALVPSGAHLAALPNKIDLQQADYFMVQGIYRGWAVLGWLWVFAFLLNALLAFLVRSQRRPLRLSAMAALCFAVMFVIFLVWTQPANQATANWTTVPANWGVLRHEWEYSHAVNAAVALLALGLTTLSTLCWRRSVRWKADREGEDTPRAT